MNEHDSLINKENGKNNFIFISNLIHESINIYLFTVDNDVDAIFLMIKLDHDPHKPIISRIIKLIISTICSKDQVYTLIKYINWYNEIASEYYVIYTRLHC